MFAVLVNDGSGNYIPYANNDFPTGKVFNEELSGCIDNNGEKINGVLTFNNSTHTATIDSDKTLSCYFYFDDQGGEIYVRYAPNGISYNGATLYAVKVADFDNNSCSYVLNSAFSASGIDLSSLLEEFYSYYEEDEICKIGSENKEYDYYATLPSGFGISTLTTSIMQYYNANKEDIVSSGVVKSAVTQTMIFGNNQSVTDGAAAFKNLTDGLYIIFMEETTTLNNNVYTLIPCLVPVPYYFVGEGEVINYYKIYLTPMFNNSELGGGGGGGPEEPPVPDVPGGPTPDNPTPDPTPDDPTPSPDPTDPSDPEEPLPVP